MSVLRAEHLSKKFGANKAALDKLSLTLEPGEFFCLLGPSGCGKSTLLRLLGGYLAADSGQIFLNERAITGEPPEKRGTGMVFQNYALFPHLSVLDNVAFGLRVRGIRRVERRRKAAEMLTWIGLTEEEWNRKPRSLSGGQQQRVAVARALITEPALLMLDEPFANLDRLLRERLREEIRDLQGSSGTTTLLVTHDREEAFAIADRIGIMSEGRLLQVGTPQNIFHTPATVFVADFLGHRNLIPVADYPDQAALPKGSGGTVLLHQKELILHLHEVPNSYLVTVTQCRFAATHYVLSVELASGITIEVLHYQLSIGETRWLEIPPQALSLLSA